MSIRGRSHKQEKNDADRRLVAARITRFSAERRAACDAMGWHGTPYMRVAAPRNRVQLDAITHPCPGELDAYRASRVPYSYECLRADTDRAELAPHV